MASWVEITALIIAIFAFAGVIGLLIWYLVALGGQGSYTVTEVTGAVKTAKTGGGNLYFINSSTSTEDFILQIESNSSASKGKSFYIINNGAGKIIAAGPTGNNVVFPATTIAPRGRASFMLVDSNKYNKVFQQ
jgi:hypothetical protein